MASRVARKKANKGFVKHRRENYKPPVRKDEKDPRFYHLKIALLGDTDCVRCHGTGVIGRAKGPLGELRMCECAFERGIFELVGASEAHLD